MIRFDRLELEGALCYGNGVFPLANQGMTLVQGINKDAGGSNGSGKSSWIAALEHIIFATTAKGLKKNAIISDLAKEGYYGRLYAEVNGVQIEAHQARNDKHGNSNWILKDGVDQKIKGANESQAEITKAFGLTLEDWYATVHFPQQYRHLFIRSTENDAKKAMLARIFALNYEAYKVEVDQKLVETRQALLQLKANLSASKATLEAQVEQMEFKEVASYESLIEGLNNQIKELAGKIQEADNNLRLYNSAKVAKATRDNHRDLLVTQLTTAGLWTGAIPNSQSLVDAVEQARETLAGVRKQIKDFESYLEYLKQREAAWLEYAPYKDIVYDLVEVTAKQTQLNQTKEWLIYQKQTFGDGSIFDLRGKLEADFNQLGLELGGGDWESAVKAEKELKQSAELKKRDLTNEYSRLHGQLQILEKGTCNTCGQPIPSKLAEDVKAQMESIKAEIDKLKDQIDGYTENIEAGEFKIKTYSDAKAKLDAVEAKFSDPAMKAYTTESWKQSIKTMEEQSDALSNWLTAYNTFKAAESKWAPFNGVDVGSADEYRKSIDTFKQSETSFVEHITKLEGVIPAIRQFEALPEVEIPAIDELALNGYINQWREESNGLSSKVAVYNSDKARLKSLLDQLEQIKGKEIEIKTYEDQEQIYQSLSFAFGPKGLIVSRLDVICKHLTDKANYYLSKIMRDNITLKFFMDGSAIDLDVQMNNRTRGIGNLSGGEGLKVGLACMLGLRSLIPDKYQTNILMLDETDQNWDQTTRLEYYDVLENLLVTTKLESIFVISHAQELQELQAWNNRWVVTKSEGVSSIEILTS